MMATGLFDCEQDGWHTYFFNMQDYCSNKCTSNQILHITFYKNFNGHHFSITMITLIINQFVKFQISVVFCPTVFDRTL